MPVLSAKTQKSGFEAVTAKVEAKKQEERERAIANEALKSFSIKSLEKKKSRPATDASGLNFTVKRNIGSKETNLNINISVKSITGDRQKQVQTEAIANKETSKNEKTGRGSSIISGSQKIQELQDLQKQLSRSYKPKPLFEPRRPTMESIKQAIEKARLDEASRNKNVGTDGLYFPETKVVVTSDVSTSVDKSLLKKKKIAKKKKQTTPETVSASSARSASTSSPGSKPTSADQQKNTKPKKYVINIPKTRKKIHVKAKVDSNLRPTLTPSSSSDEGYGNPGWPDD